MSSEILTVPISFSKKNNKSQQNLQKPKINIFKLVRKGAQTTLRRCNHMSYIEILEKCNSLKIEMKINRYHKNIHPFLKH